MSYQLAFPGKTFFGAGSVEKLRDCLPKGAKVLLAVGNHVKKSGLLERLMRILADFETVVFCGIRAEPPLPEVDELIGFGRRNAVSAIVAVGGGSVLDAAKAAAAIIPLDGTVGDYFYQRKAIPGKGLFFAALPTTAGTGTEATPNSVLSDPDTDIKKSIRHDSMFPDLAIVDPELTYSCPADLTAHSGLDALTQAIESYISRNANTVSKALAARAVQLIFAALPKVCADLNDKNARRDMAEGSMAAALAFAQSGLGAVHGLGHPIGSKLHVPHGLCCAILLPKILRRNQDYCSEALDELALNCSCAGGEFFVEKIEKLCRDLNIPADFRKFGMEREIFPFVLKNCRSGSMRSNPRSFEDGEIIEILESLL
ncbi:MAG: iron-containing alcohol dehydrogenase [Victivallaceae bacterium]|nr:iron-containing alcohol dehydrogenase [Victivallaceae bacterium]